MGNSVSSDSSDEELTDEEYIKDEFNVEKLNKNNIIKEQEIPKQKNTNKIDKIPNKLNNNPDELDNNPDELDNNFDESNNNPDKLDNNLDELDNNPDKLNKKSNLLPNKFIRCFPDELDNSDLDYKINHDIENILHNIFLLKDLKKLKKLNLNNYNINKNNVYLELLLNMYNTIVNSEIIDDILNDFPFEYQEYYIDYVFEDFKKINFFNSFLNILSYYKNKNYSKDFLLYNLLEDSEQNYENVRGFTIKDTFKSINKNGITLNNHEFEASYNDFKNAKLRGKINYYKVKQNLNDLKHLLKNNNPIICSISIYKINDNKIILDRKKKYDIPMIIIGYNDFKKEFIIRNDKNYNISYSYILNKKLCRDFWHIKIN